MPSVGVPELIVILMILVLVFGGSRLPHIGESMGRAIRGFKRGIASDDTIEVTPGTGGSAPKPDVSASEPVDADVVDKG